MKLRNLRLTLSSVARTANSKTMEASNVTPRRCRLKDGTFSDELEGYDVECVANRGDTLKIKLPLTVEEKVKTLKEHLLNDHLVELSFTGLKLFAYAMNGHNNSTLSGVSGKADDFEIHVRTDIDFDVDIDID